MENYIVIKGYPNVSVGTILKWSNESDAFKIGDNLLSHANVVNNKEYFTIATDLVFIAVLDTHQYEEYYVTNIYVGSDYDKAEKSLIDAQYVKDFCVSRFIETWVNGVKIAEKYLDI